MSSRARQSTARPRASIPSNATPRATASGPRASMSTPLPAYEPMQFPLSAKAQRALAVLKQDNGLNEFETDLKASTRFLTDFAADVNEKVYFQGEDLQGRRKRFLKRKQHISQSQNENEAEAGLDEDEQMQELETSHAEFKDNVKTLTNSMEEMTRKMIDCSQATYWLRKALEDAHTVSAQRTFESQQVRQSQRRRGPRRGGADDEEGEDEEMTGETQVTNPFTQVSTAAPAPDSTPLDLFRQSLQKSQTAYTSLSKPSRYAQNNDYVGFKRAVHDASYPPDEAPPLPPAKTWFAPAKGSPEPGTAQVDSDEEDFAVLHEKISTKCPLSMVEFRDPVTSTKCPHTFERASITEFIETGTQRIDDQPGRRGRGAKCCNCPVAGCDVKITLADLHTDDRILRHIRKVQEHRRRMAEEAGSDDEERNGGRRSGAIPIMSDAVDADGADGEMDIDEIERQTQTQAQVKKEKQQAMRRSGRSSRRVVEHDDEDEDEA